MRLPTKPTPREEVFADLDAAASGDADWRCARTFSLVYQARKDVLEVAQQAYLRFFSENALNPMAFPSLRRFERDVMGMTADLFHAPEGAAGTMTSGGSESLLMAVKTARDWARVERANVTAPEMLLPVTAHPALEKAAHYFGVKPVHVPVGPDLRADVEAARCLAGPSTILVVGSAPAYPHGVVDPIEPLAALAAERGALFHVDACLGGFLLPFVERLGHAVPPFDFRVPGGDLDVRRRPQVRVRGEGRVDVALPIARAAAAPVVRLRRLARRPLRVAEHDRHAARAEPSPRHGPSCATSARRATSTSRASRWRPPRA